jgi:hypothetical protein
MIIGIQGSRNFEDYQVFLRAMGSALYDLDGDTEFTILSAGPHKVNEMAMEFTNVSERSLKARGIKAKVVKMPAIALKERIHDLDYFVYFSLPKEPESDLVREAQDKDIEVGIYRYA